MQLTEILDWSSNYGSKVFMGLRNRIVIQNFVMQIIAGTVERKQKFRQQTIT